jgi:TPR repeat protein
MATRGSPLARKPLPLMEDHEPENARDYLNKKALPNIPIPKPELVHNAPKSPIRINVQAGKHRASSAQIEGGDGYTWGEETEGTQVARSVNSPLRGAENQTESAYRASPKKSPPRKQHGRNDSSRHASSGSLGVEDDPEPVPQLQYFHEMSLQENRAPAAANRNSATTTKTSTSDPIAAAHESGIDINRHLTPNSHGRRSVLQRPASTYSMSDAGARGRSPGVPGSPGLGPYTPTMGRSPDNRPLSYVDLLQTSYPQPPPVPLPFDNSQLRNVVGTNASLLSTEKTLEMYRQNVKKTNDSSLQYAFAVFLIQAAQEAGLTWEASPPRKLSPKRDLESPYVETASASPQELVREARGILQKLADRSYPFAQYYLADGYASGLFNKGKEDYDRAFPLFVAASKHGHAESGYRAALCYEFGWGTGKNPSKAIQFYRQSASKNHPGAMTRLGRACLTGDLGVNNYREGLKWLRRATEQADPQYNAAPYHLALLHETGYGDDVFKDETYAAQLLTKAAELGHVEANYRLGDAYEHGKLGCPRDPALSVHFYTGAAQAGHPAAMMALCAWYMVGAEPVLEKDEAEAYEWARRAAECGKFCPVHNSILQD